MFLKRLEVVGFKSFADKVYIDFVPGVTAVVGPNGSGKSNIADSIRWVLGEQSAKSLRGAKMEDIIFAGSDSRQSLNLAEVTLVLDNSDGSLAIDYSEVNVTRRVYRSGESEYLINNQSCRLKDIVELFLDSGIGKEAYSIIGQGKVDEILNSKPEDRRTIFEEAAGVLKYKNRKITAEKRLIETKDNLNRVEDILYELDGQIEPLQEQAAIAKEYLIEREQLKDIDISLQVHEITGLHTLWTEEKEKLRQLKEDHHEYQKNLEKMEEERSTLREKSTQHAKIYNETQEQLLKTSEEFEKNSGRQQLLNERKKNASFNKEQLEKAIAEKEEQLFKLNKEWNIAEEERVIGKKRLDELELTVKRKKKLVESSDIGNAEEIERLKADYIEILNEQASIRNEQRYLVEQKRQLEVRKDRLLSDNESLVNNREELIEQLNKAKEVAEEKSAHLEQESRKYRKQKEEHTSKQELYRKKETELYESYQLTQRLQSRADVLAEMQADFSGFFHGVKEVLKVRERLSGVVGAVAELVDVPKQYETALEIALGGASQHIVMETEEDARKAIHYLKENRSGRATFLPIPVMNPRFIPEHLLDELKKHHSFVGVAATLLSVPEKYERVMLHLLGHVIVVKDLAGANEVARMAKHRYRIVTLEGDVVNPGGSMTGGSVKQKQTPILGRKRELATLEKRLQQMSQVTEKLEAEVKQLKSDLNEELQSLEHIANQIEAMRVDVQEMNSKVRELTREVEIVEVQFSRFDREQLGFNAEEMQMTSRLDELVHLHEKAISEANMLEQEVKRLEEEREQFVQSRETLQEELVTDQIALATERERYTGNKGNVERLTEQKKHLEEELIQFKQDYEFLIDEIKNGLDGETTLVKRMDEGEREKAQLTTKLTQLKDEQRMMNEAYMRLEENLKIQQEEYQLIANECSEIEVKVNRADVELDNRLNHLAEEYELSFEAAKEQYKLTIDPEEARMKVNLIKLKIEELGTINLGAIEEYERICERHTFLKEQQADLTEAKSTLHEVIAEMDAEMTARFYETYRHIRSNFQTVFKQLFGGGDADLILTDPDQLLFTGVDIIARPPGKKMQHLSLLSGGERSLTAIALLFAILYVRPVPFCVLDEVEAALDEANVSRFAQFLKDFSTDTQFIVITHRKGTMEEADVLYGVTMQESGVSKLVSVKLEETKELIES